MNSANDYNLNPSYSAGHSVRIAPQRERISEFGSPIEISGIEFTVLREGKWIALQCEEWPSLSGYGSTLDEAREMLYEVIEEAKNAYVECSEHELTQKALRFRAFLIERLTA